MRLRFTIGPVQEVVRQSRRTRDLWASSFLLSYLSGCAMAGAVAHGRIVVPNVEGDALFDRIRGVTRDEAVRVGSLPNRFELDTTEPEAAARSARAALDKRWKRICNAVWETYVAPIAHKGRRTEGIFRRQVESFWEIQWVAAPDEEQMKGLLERRKAWRSRIPTEEPGDKCVVMPELQELSGYIRARSKEDREHQQEFWEALKREGRVQDVDIQPHECLCGVALVKRMVPRREVATRALGWDPEAVRWRSTVYVAAIPWIDEVLQRDPQRCQEYADQVCKLDRGAEREIANRTTRTLIAGGGGRFARLDANYFFVDAIGNAEATLAGLAEGAGEREDLTQRLQALYAVGDMDPIGPPASFYALLLMDGDRVGSLLASLGGDRVSAALAAFTRRVAPIVEGQHRGYVVYAGGDDVLAMVPVPHALACARALRDAYRASFGVEVGATTSASVVFAQIRQPLRQVLEESHRLLDDVAKERNGRDSLAVSLLRRGDRTLEWVTTWDDSDGGDRLAAVHALRDVWRGKAQRQRAGDQAPLAADEISTGLMYRVRELMGMLCGWQRWEPGICRAYAGGDPLKLLAAEIRRAFRSAGLYDGGRSSESTSQRREEEQQQEAEAMARLLLRVSHPAERREGLVVIDDRRIGMDGALLALFLSTDGKEREHGAMENG
ncbi:MAG: hypothetical protein IT372_39995 [Polyangiaceae bacterium]|nr:hypothetical protein [Polyangiaceae bacterium]